MVFESKKILISSDLTQMYGTSVLRVDKYMRTMGFLGRARNNLLQLDEKSLQDLQAYADGINNYVDSIDMIPVEFMITHTRFKKWTPLD